MTTTISPASIWLEALNVEERVAWLRAGCRLPQRSADPRTAWRISKWRDTFGKNVTRFETALQAAGISCAEFEAALGLKVDAALDVGGDPPQWIEDLEAICLHWPARTGNAAHVRGFVVRGMDALRDAIADTGSSQLQGIADGVWSQLDDELTHALSWMCLKSLVLEVNASRLLGTLIGDTPQERHRQFLDRIATPEGARRFYSMYPVLARKLAATTERWADAVAECVGRVSRDRRALEEAFGGGQTLGALSSISGPAGDVHANHRAVRVVTFESGVRVVYKPRPIELDRHFQELLCWLNDRGWQPAFRARQQLPRGEYGWNEYVQKSDCSDSEMVRRFYERQGGLLALTFLLSGIDFHSENVVASGEHPFLIDVETLFRAPFATTTSRSEISPPEARTVVGVGLLPRLQMATAESPGVDLSGIGGRGGQTVHWPFESVSQVGTDEMRVTKEHGVLREYENRPTRDGAPVDPLVYEGEVVAGFTRMYDLVMTYRDEFICRNGPVLQFAHDPMRVIVRPTRLYASLLGDALHPDVTRSALDQDRLFDSLWRVSDLPSLASIVRAEQRDLRNGDIPLFTGRVDSTSISTSAGDRVDDVFACSGLEVVADRVRKMSSGDRARQAWHIRSAYQIAKGRPALASRRPYDRSPLRTRCLAIATAIGKRLVELAFDQTGGTTWSTVQPSGPHGWRIANVSDDVYSGRSGIVLFLAYLAKETRDPEIEQLSRTVAWTIARHTEEPGVSGVGGYNGASGVVYALAHLGFMWRDPELVQRATRLAGALLAQMEADNAYDVVAGAAGGVLALLACEEVLSSANVIPIVTAAGDRLVHAAVSLKRGCGWLVKSQDRPLTGFAHGAAGIGYALAKLAARVGSARYGDYARGAFEYERDVFSQSEQNWPDFRKDVTTPSDVAGHSYGSAWCNGAAGIGLSRLLAADCFDDEDMRPEIRIAVRTTLAHGTSWNHSLCHGEFGNLEFLRLGAAALDDPWMAQEVARREIAAVDAVEAKGPLCGSDRDITPEIPGLMTGLAGIGYGLLQIACPSMPSMLSLSPPLRDC